MKKAVIFCLFFLICSLIFAQNRFALLIGNSNYLDPEERLPNAINDTQDIKEALEGLGFKVELKHDLKRLDLIKEVAAFINRLKSNRNSEGFFWYAGHGFEIEGKIYLLPVDVVMDVDREDDIEIKANSFPVTDLTDLLSLTRNKINIIVLDTCREPSGKNRGAGDTSRVIKNVPNFPAETLVIFSTAPGKTSDDGKGKNSPFTEAFLTNIKSTEPVVQMMGHVTTQTLSLTRQKQHPYLISNLGRENVSYTLNNNVSLPPPPPPPPPPFPFSNGLRHEIIANYIAITGYTGTSPTLVIPDRIQNLPVTMIAEKAFENNKTLTSITIPSSVTVIGDSAFDSCSNLTNITIPSSVLNIGKWAFFSTNLSSITIPSSVTIINLGTFSNCTNLSSITIPSSVTSIGSSAFSSCSKLPNITIPSSVTSIGSSAFSGCSKLPNITIPSSVTKIEASAFDYCSMLSMINVDNRNTYFSAQDGVLFDYDKQIIIRYPIGKYGNSYAIPSSVRTIGPSAFDSSNLTNVIIPSSVTNIGRFAFYSCKGLTSIIIPSSVTSIDASAFSYCENLTSITIPSSVTSIGSRAFSYCSKLSSVTISRRTQLKEDVFPSSVKIIFSD